MAKATQNENLAGKARIKVIGIGGGGGNAVNRMIERGVENIDMFVINTDNQDLNRSRVPEKNRIRIGLDGLGAGTNPDAGRKAAESSIEEIKAALVDTDMLFITAGLGGGTGTGATPVVARIAREMGILTVAVVTTPFKWEGQRKMEAAIKGMQETQENVDTLIKIPNEKLREYMKLKQKSEDAKRTATPIALNDALKEGDNVLCNGVEGISDIIMVPGLMNLDFKDVNTIMTERGSAYMGIGEARGEDRARQAAIAAMYSPLLEHGIDGAKAVIFNVTAPPNFSFDDLDTISEIIHEHVSTDALIKVGCVLKEDFDEDLIRVTVIATGFQEGQQVRSTREKEAVELVRREQPAATPAQSTHSTQSSVVGGTPSQSATGNINETEDFWKMLGIEPPGFLTKKENN